MGRSRRACAGVGIFVSCRKSVLYFQELISKPPPLQLRPSPPCFFLKSSPPRFAFCFLSIHHPPLQSTIQQAIAVRYADKDKGPDTSKGGRVRIAGCGDALL